MKTTSITVERNFHIMNDDRFIMEKISVTKELDESDQDMMQIIIDDARATIVNNFKAAYPHIKTYLNFDEVIQVNHNHNSDVNSMNVASKISINAATEKINKGTIEEQIEACAEIELPNGLKSFEIIASMNPNLKVLYNNKLKLLNNQLKRANKQTV